MTKNEIKQKFTTGDLRGKGGVDTVLAEYEKDSSIRKDIFEFVFSANRLLAMRAIDAYEKISRKEGVREEERDRLLKVMGLSKPKEFMWHYVQILGYMSIPKKLRDTVFQYLKEVLYNYEGSRIVTVFALQSLFDQFKEDSQYASEVRDIVQEMSKSTYPSVKTRALKLLSLF
jgi:hypothetical protein